MSEKWVDLFGYEDRYLASSNGSVRHKKPRAGVGLLRACPNKYGYLRVCICRRLPDGSFLRARSETVHRLIWQSFNGPIPKGMNINHKNGKKGDNRLDNLEVCTPSQNTAHAYRVLGRVHPQTGSRAKTAKLHERDIPGIRERCRNGESKEAMARDFGVSRMVIYNIAWRKTWKHVP